MSATELNPYDAPVAKEEAPTVKASYLSSVAPTIVLAGLLFFCWAASGATLLLAFGLAVLIVPAQLGLLLFSMLGRRQVKNAVTIRLLRMGIYAVMLGVMFQFPTRVRGATLEDAKQIVQACESYAEDHGGLPEDLSQLVPKYLPSLPSTRQMEYFYLPPKDGSPASFMYVPAPFVRWIYNFETHEWRSFLS